MDDFGYDQGTIEYSVNTVTNSQIIFLRLDMDVGRASSKSVLDDHVNNFRNRRLRTHFPRNRRGFDRLALFGFGGFLFNYLQRFGNFGGNRSALDNRLVIA